MIKSAYVWREQENGDHIPVPISELSQIKKLLMAYLIHLMKLLMKMVYLNMQTGFWGSPYGRAGRIIHQIYSSAMKVGEYMFDEVK